MPTPQELAYQQLLAQIMPRQQPGITLGGLTSNQGLLGLGLMGGSFLGKEEPGYVTEARQNIRNLGTPTGFSSGFTNTVGGLQSQFQPLIDQQQRRSLDEISQRYTAAFPGRAGAQPQEFGGYATYLRDQFQPGVQNFYGQMGLQGLNTQLNANQQIMALDRPDPFKEALSQLGGALILGTNQGGMGQSGGFNLGGLLGGGQQQGAAGGGFPGGGLPGGEAGIGQSIGGLLQSVGGNPQLLSPQIQQMLYSGLQSAFPQGTFSAGFGGLENLGNGTYAVTQTSGQMVGIYNPSTGMVTNSATGATAPLSQGGFFAPQAAGTTGLQGLFGGTGLMGAPGFGSMAGIMSGAGSGIAGYGVGNLVGSQLPNTRLGSTAAGAASGAATGFLIGGPVGAAIGALAGGIGGFTGGRKVDHEIKATQLSNDLKSANLTATSMGAFWTEALGSAGYGDIDGFASFIRSNASAGGDRPWSFDGFSYNGHISDASASIGSKLLLKQIQQGGHPEITSLNQIPGFRDKYVEWILGNTYIGGEGSAGLSHPSNIAQKGNLLLQAGLSY